MRSVLVGDDVRERARGSIFRLEAREVTGEVTTIASMLALANGGVAVGQSTRTHRDTAVHSQKVAVQLVSVRCIEVIHKLERLHGGMIA